MRPLTALLLFLFLVPAASCFSSSDDVASDGQAHIGEPVKAGSLDLTVLQIDPGFDARPFNDFTKANIAVHVRATNARGDANKTAELLPLAFRLADKQGVIYGADLNCTRCPGELQVAALNRDTTVEGTLYFALPEGREPSELRYEPLLTRDKARIALR